MSTVRFNYADVSSNVLRNKRALKIHIRELFQMEGKQLKEINYILCSDEFLLEINRTYLKHDYYTDIVTFNLSESEGIVGEVYVSVDRVRENSRSHSVSFLQEMLRVLFHGALHLTGYKDKKKSEITKMREKEDYYLRLFAAK